MSKQQKQKLKDVSRAVDAAERVSDAEAKLPAANDALAKAQGALAKAEQAAAAAAAAADAARAQVAAQKAKVADAQAKMDALKAKIAAIARQKSTSTGTNPSSRAPPMPRIRLVRSAGQGDQTNCARGNDALFRQLTTLQAELAATLAQLKAYEQQSKTKERIAQDRRDDAQAVRLNPPLMQKPRLPGSLTSARTRSPSRCDCALSKKQYEELEARLIAASGIANAEGNESQRRRRRWPGA